MFKYVTALIEPGKLEDIIEALEESGIKEVTIIKCGNFNSLKGWEMIFRGKKQKIDFLPEIRLETVVEEEKVKRVLEVIQKAQDPTQDGADTISIIPIEEAIFLGKTDQLEGPASDVGIK